MKGLIAQAYQMSLGKTDKEAKENRNAMKELTDAMSKGKVKPDKIFPILVDLMKQAAAEGTEAARKSPSAQEDRFWNRMEKGWENFTKGGGAKGIATFWEDMTGSIGKWWEDNSAALGKRFEGMVLWFTAIRASITESIQTLWTGEETSISEYLREKYSVDLQHIRSFLSDLWEWLKGVVRSVAGVVGLVDEQTGKVNFEEFGNRLRNFGSSVAKAISNVMEMFSGLARILELSSELASGGYVEVSKSFIPGTDAFKKRNEITSLFIKAIGSGFSATAEAGKAAVAPVLPSTSSLYKTQTEDTSKPLPYKLSSMVVGDGRSAMSLRQHKLAFPELYPPSAPGAEMRIPTALSSGMPIPRKIIPQDDISKLGTGMYTPTAVDELLRGDVPLPGAAQGGQSFGLNAQRLDNMRGLFPYNRTDELGRVLRPVTSEYALPAPSATQKQSLDVNVNLTVSGDPESVKAFASQELKDKIAESVPDMVGYMIDEKWNYKLRSALVNGVKP